MRQKFYLFIFLAALIGFSSCSSMRIEKRHYNKGWYVDFGTEKKSESVGVSDQDEKADAEALPTEKQSVATPMSLSSDPNNTQQQAGIVSNEQYAVVIASGEAPAANETPDQGTEQGADQFAVPKNSPPSEQIAPAGDDQVLLVILAILVPPLAVYMVQGTTAIFWITLICWLFGGFFFFGRFGYGYLGGLGLLAIVLALLVVFGKL